MTRLCRPSSQSGKRRFGKHTSDLAEGLVPPELPVISAEAREDDLVLTIDDRKDAIETVPQSEVSTALAQIYAELGVATRVEVHGSDGRVLVDILNPPREEPKPGTAEQEESPDNDSAETTGLVKVSGDGSRPVRPSLWR